MLLRAYRQTDGRRDSNGPSSVMMTRLELRKETENEGGKQERNIKVAKKMEWHYGRKKERKKEKYRRTEFYEYVTSRN